jgi:hypothetical protein
MKLLSDDILVEIIKKISMKMKYEQEAMAEDDPNGTCYAHHKGSINAYGGILKDLNELLNQK